MTKIKIKTDLIYMVLRDKIGQFLVLSLSPDNDVMATSKRCVKLFLVIFIVTVEMVNKI